MAAREERQKAIALALEEERLRDEAERARVEGEDALREMEVAERARAEAELPRRFAVRGRLRPICTDLDTGQEQPRRPFCACREMEGYHQHFPPTTERDDSDAHGFCGDHRLEGWWRAYLV